MNATLLNAIVVLVPVSALLAYSGYVKRRTMPTLLQLLGAGCLLIVVVLTHVAEALRLFPAMRFGERDSMGHRLDLVSAVVDMTVSSGWRPSTDVTGCPHNRAP